MAEIALYAKAASDHIGYAKLHIPNCFDTNRGMASLEPFEKDLPRTYEVPLTTLEELASTVVNRKIGVVKIDVEGHELSALMGGIELFKSGAIRDVVFEEHGTPPTPVTKWLEQWGYQIFYLSAGIFGPRVIPLDASRNTSHYPWEAPSYLATNDPQRAVQRLQRRGWEVLDKAKRLVTA